MPSPCTQATLLSHRPAPLPTEWRTYVPVLQTRKGELDALEHLRDGVWARTVPLIALSAHRRELKSPLNVSTVRAWVKRIAHVAGAHPIYLDLLHPRATFQVAVRGARVPVLEEIYEAARRRGLSFLPVAPVGAGKQHLRIVGDAAAHDGHGLAVRYRFRSQAPKPGRTLAGTLQDLLTRLGHSAESADLLLDAGWIDPDVEISVDDVADVVRASLELPWRSVVFLGTCVPETMGCIKEGSIGSIRRNEWHLWRELIEQELPRVPAFGDYGVQHPKRPASSGPGMRRNVRYTTNEELVVARAEGAFTESSNDQYRELCKWLVDLGAFRGADYSWGDRTIAGCADETLRPRSQEMWRGAGTSHHLQFVSDQLRAL